MNNALIRAGLDEARKAFEKTSESNKWLNENDLAVIFESGNYPSPEKYSYDPDSVRKRGRERCSELLSMIPGSVKGFKSLEAGALDARTSYYLAKHGVEAHAIDITDSHFSEKVRSGGVDCRLMSATELDYPDNFFNLVFSFNAFEHIDDPEKALMESIRVLKPGGYIYLNFGPVWSSPFGAHGHEAIPIPYIQYLWREDVILEFCLRKGLGTIEFDTINKWPFSKYRDLFKKYSGDLKILSYSERLDSHGIELVKKYPGCFRGKVDNLDELVVSAIEILLQKK